MRLYMDDSDIIISIVALPSPSCKVRLLWQRIRR